MVLLMTRVGGVRVLWFLNCETRNILQEYLSFKAKLEEFRTYHTKIKIVESPVQLLVQGRPQ